MGVIRKGERYPTNTKTPRKAIQRGVSADRLLPWSEGKLTYINTRVWKNVAD